MNVASPIQEGLQTGALLNNTNEVCIRKWNVNNKKVRLILKDGCAFYRITSNGIVIKQSPPCPPHLTEAVIAIGSISQIILDNLNIGFCDVLGEWEFKKIKISLLLHKNDAVWEIFDKTTERKKWKSFSATFTSSNCHKETFGLFEDFKKRVRADSSYSIIRSFLEDFEITEVVQIDDTDIEFTEIEGTQDGRRVARWIFGSPSTFTSGSDEWEQDNLPSEMHDILKIEGTLEKEEDIKNYRLTVRKILKNRNPVFISNEELSKEETIDKIYPRIWADVFKNNIFSNDFKKFNVKQVQQKHTFTRISSQEPDVIIQSKKLAISQDISKQATSLIKSIMPFYVVVEPKTIPSIIDPHVKLSKLRWSACLVFGSGCCGQHTELIVEGINDGFFPEEKENHPKKGESFLYLLHLTGPNSIKFKLLDPAIFTYKERTQVFLFPSKKVKKMINDTIDESEKPIKFNALGCDSIFSGRAHSCFTWARDKLRKMGLELGWVAFGFIATEPKSFTHPNEYYEKNPVLQKI